MHELSPAQRLGIPSQRIVSYLIPPHPIPLSHTPAPALTLVARVHKHLDTVEDPLAGPTVVLLGLGLDEPVSHASSEGSASRGVSLQGCVQ